MKYKSRGSISKKRTILYAVGCLVICQISVMCCCCCYLFLFKDLISYLGEAMYPSGEKYLLFDWRRYDNGCHQILSHEFLIAQPTRQRRFDSIYRLKPFDMEIDLIYSPYEDIYVLNHHYNHTLWDVCDVKYYRNCDYKMFEFDEYLSNYGDGISSLILDVKSSLFFGEIKDDMVDHMLKLLSKFLDKHGLKERTLIGLYYISNVVAQSCLRYNLRYAYKSIQPLTNKMKIRDYVDMMKEYPMLEGLIRPVKNWNFQDLKYFDFEYANENGIAVIPWDDTQHRSSNPPSGSMGYIVIDYNSETLHRMRLKYMFFPRFSAYKWCYQRSRQEINPNAKIIQEKKEIVDNFLSLSWKVLREIKNLDVNKLS